MAQPASRMRTARGSSIVTRSEARLFRVRNAKAVFSVFFSGAALGALVVGALGARYRTDFGIQEVAIAVGVAFCLGVIGLSLARRARFDYQRSVGRIGGRGIAALGRLAGTVAILVATTAGLAFGVFAVLTFVLD